MIDAPRLKIQRRVEKGYLAQPWVHSATSGEGVLGAALGADGAAGFPQYVRRHFPFVGDRTCYSVGNIALVVGGNGAVQEIHERLRRSSSDLVSQKTDHSARQQQQTRRDRLVDILISFI